MANEITHVNRVLVLYALAECLGNKSLIREIENVSGRLGCPQVERFEKKLSDQIVTLRSEGQWPLTMHNQKANASIPEILKERYRNIHGDSWIRNHGTNDEGFALCSLELHPEKESCDLSTGEITCMDCIALIDRCRSICDEMIAPEIDNVFLNRRLRKKLMEI